MTAFAKDYKELLDLSKTLLEQQANLYGEDLFIKRKSAPHHPAISEKIQPVTLDVLRQQVIQCKKCELHRSRKNVVFGEGNPKSEIMLVGEAPGQEEDLQGKPFVGAAGQLLDKILMAVKLSREEVFIANVLKCRPPQNRDPQPAEIEQCKSYLWEQIELIQPKIILGMGRFAGQVLLGQNESLAQMRGKVYQHKQYYVVVTYHPAALLRHTEWKRPTWEDVKLLRRKYDEIKGNPPTEL